MSLLIFYSTFRIRISRNQISDSIDDKKITFQNFVKNIDHFVVKCVVFMYCFIFEKLFYAKESWNMCKKKEYEVNCAGNSKGPLDLKVKENRVKLDNMV